jgi:DNA-binding MarR family transcriptional regulator
VVTQAERNAGHTEVAGQPIPRGIERSLGLLLARLGGVLTEIADEQLADVGLTGREYGILSILVEDGPESQLELARMIGKTPPLVVPSIDRLENAGFVERTRDPTDRRRTRVTLTAKGAKTLSRGDVIAERVVATALRGLDESELADLAQLLHKGIGAWRST